MSINSADNRNSTKVSKSSTYLSNEENELVFRLVGRRSISQCTTVAQLYLTEGPTHSRWIKKFTGALCFVKDNAKRTYYCRMFCLMRHEMVWEQEMYDTIDLARSRPYLLTFEGQVMPTKRDNLHKMYKWLNEAIHTCSKIFFLRVGFFMLKSKESSADKLLQFFKGFLTILLHVHRIAVSLPRDPQIYSHICFRMESWHWILHLRRKPKPFCTAQRRQSLAAIDAAKVRWDFRIYHGLTISGLLRH